MDLDPEAFNAFIADVGQDVLWRRASKCPCRNPDSGAPRQGCPICHAQGVIWAAPIPATVGVTSMRVKREYAAFGLWESGDEVLTFPSDSPAYACGESDRIIMQNSSEPFQAVLTRGDEDRVLFSVLSIDQAFWLNGAGDTMIQATANGGLLPTIAPDGTVVWAAGQGPSAGVQFSLRGRKHQEYFMMPELPQDRAHFHGLDLPRRCQFRRFDLFGRVASNQPTT